MPMPGNGFVGILRTNIFLATTTEPPIQNWRAGGSRPQQVFYLLLKLELEHLCTTVCLLVPSAWPRSGCQASNVSIQRVLGLTSGKRGHLSWLARIVGEFNWPIIFANAGDTHSFALCILQAMKGRGDRVGSGSMRMPQVVTGTR